MDFMVDIQGAFGEEQEVLLGFGVAYFQEGVFQFFIYRVQTFTFDHSRLIFIIYFIFIIKFRLQSMLSKKIFSLFSRQIGNKSLNSIGPEESFVAFGYYFPKDWTPQTIYTHLDPSKTSISQIKIIKNRLGDHSGKVLLKFTTEYTMQEYIKKYNEDFIITKDETYRVILKPFQLKTNIDKFKREEVKTKNIVKISNLDFDINQREIDRLAKDYGEVKFIEMKMKQNGQNNGVATVYFSKKKEAQDFTYFCDGLQFRERKLKAEVINPQKIIQIQQSFLKEPTITMEANERLYKKMVANEIQKKQKLN